ncbi:cytochrome c [Sulfurimonas sp.]|uniref:c-type cytochrome n=1 Tax=Sulfurimonas sp. TaxID=2022749 RepID=UPI003568EB93
MKIVLSVVLALFLVVGCSNESKEEVQKSQPKTVLQDSAPVKSAPMVEILTAPKEVVVKDAPVASAALDAKTLFNACASCHGQNAEKSALGKSKIIKGWSPQDIKLALNGYKDGSYGGTMKSIMKGQASKLNDEQIIVLADYISKL